MIVHIQSVYASGDSPIIGELQSVTENDPLIQRTAALKIAKDQVMWSYEFTWPLDTEIPFPDNVTFGKRINIAGLIPSGGAISVAKPEGMTNLIEVDTIGSVNSDQYHKRGGKFDSTNILADWIDDTTAIASGWCALIYTKA